MHAKAFSIRIGILVLISLFFSTANAQTVSYDILLDTDRNSATGCSVTPIGQGNSNGFERRIQAIVDSGTLTVTEVNLAFCNAGTFGPAAVIGGPHPVGLNNGVNGTDVVELSTSLNSLQPLSNGVIQITVAAEDGVGSDLLATTTGDTGGGPILIFIPIAVPALGLLGLLLLIAAIGVITVRGRQRRWLSISLLAASGVVLAANFIVDGNVNDWGVINPDATDPANDSTNGAAGNDLQALFIAQENDTLFFRLDVTDLENTPPVALDDAFNVFEDNTLNVPAPGVLGNDTDADMDPITAVLMTGPTNAQAFTLNADGSFDYTPNADFNGVDTFTYTANDGAADSNPATVTITVDPVNDAPAFTVPADTTVLEDAGAQSLAGFATGISAGPPDESGQTLTFNITGNDNAGLFSAGPALASNGTLSFTPAADANGTANITVELMDNGGTANGGVDTSAPQMFAIIVTAVNDAPSFTGGPNQVVLEDAGAQTVNGWATAISAGPADEAGQTLTFNVTGNDNAALFSAGPAVNAAGDLSYTTAADANGTANITIELMDDGGTADGGVDTSALFNFSIDVTAVNDAPEFTLGADPTVLEDAGAQSINGFATAISPGPADEAGQTLTFNITGNDNAGLFITGPALDPITGNLTFTAADDANGTANITIELMDDGGTANGGVDTSAAQMFAINVTAVNDEPSFTPGGNQMVDEDAGSQMVNAWATGISAGPADEAGQTLTFNVTNNTNPALFSAGPAVAADGTLTYTPADDINGSADITIELMDDGGTADGGDDTSAPAIFSITVNAVNDAPTFTPSGNVAALEDSTGSNVPWATNILPGPVTATDEAGQMLTFNITSNTNMALFSVQPALNAGTGNLSFTPAADASGTATITVELMDNGGTANGGVDTSAAVMFDINITAVNDQPTLGIAGNQMSDEDAGAQMAAAFATAMPGGGADEAGQTFTFNVSNDNNPLFSAQPAIDATGQLTYTSAPDGHGSATVMVTVTDSGGTANGGVDTSAPPLAFMITINPVNDPPTVTGSPTNQDAIGNVNITVPAGQGLVSSITINDVDGAGAAPFTVSGGPGPGITSFMSANGGDVVITNASTGTYTYNPAAGFEGADTFSYVVCDSGIPMPPACSAAVTVNVTVADLIWFIDASAGAGGDGRIATPFNDLDVGASSFDTNAADAVGDNIFMAQGNYQGGLTLLNNQRLIGDGATGTLAAILGITVPANSAPLPALSGTRPVVTSASNGINLGAGNTIRGFNIGNAVTGVSGTNFGALTASEMLVNGTGEALDLDTGNANNVTFDSISSANSTSEGILLDSVSGSFTVTGLTNVDNATNIGVSIQNSSAAYTFGNVTVNNRNSAGVFINAFTGGAQNGQFGTVTINNQNSSATTAFGIDNTVTGGSTITVTSVAINNNGSNSSAIALSNNDGATININGGSVQNAAGAAVSVSNSTGSATYAGTISNTTGRSVQVLTNGGGSTTTFSGNITDSGTGIFLNNNTGHTINFTGVLDLDTTSNTAFTATGGGTVSANNAGSTINNTTGTGVNIANTTIGGAGVTFRSVSMSGGSSGIILNNTGNGGFTVAGDGSNAQNGSGGVIQNTTSHAVSLNNTANVTLRSMNITNPGDAAGENGINATELRGSNLIRGGVFTGQGTASSDYIRIANSTSNLTLLEVNNSDFTGVLNGGNDAILFNMSGSVTARLDVLNSNDFDGLLGDGVQVIADGLSDVTANINGNRFSNDSNIQPGGIGGNSASRLGMGTSDALLINGGILTANVIGNTMFDSGVQNGALPVGLVGVFDFVNNQAGSGIINANNNTISAIEEDGGKRFIGDDNTLLFTILVDGNTIDDVNEPGVFFHPRDNTVAADLTIRNNMIGVTTPVGTENANFNEDTIRLFSDNNAGSGSSIDILVEDNVLVTNSSSQSIDGDFEDGSNTNLTIHGNDMTNNNTGGEAFDLEADNGGDVCLDMNADNIGADSNTTDDGATSANSELHLQEDPGTVFLIEDLIGGVAAFLNGRNSLENLDIVADAPNTFAAGGNCTMPALPPAP